MFPNFTVQVPLYNSQQLQPVLGNSFHVQPRLYNSEQLFPVVQIPIYDSRQLRPGYNSVQLQPRLYNSEQLILPAYNTQQLQSQNSVMNSSKIISHYPQTGFNCNPPNPIPTSPQRQPMKYPYYPEIFPEEPSFIPAPMSSILSPQRHFHFSPIKYIDPGPGPLHEQQLEAAPQLKSVQRRQLTAAACCSFGVALSTLALCAALFVIFVVVAIKLGLDDSFCNGYVRAIFELVSLTRSHPSCPH